MQRRSDSGYYRSIAAKENSAAALFSLSMLDENKEIVGLSNGIPPLVDLLWNGTGRGKKDAITALFGLSMNHTNKGRAIRAGVAAPLLQLLRDTNLGMIDEALSILLLLASALRDDKSWDSSLSSKLSSTSSNKEYALCVLLDLASYNSNLILAALQFGVYEHLIGIKESGTARAKGKVHALLHLMSKSEHI